MEEYTVYAANNIFQIRKNQLDIQLDKNLQNSAKNHTIKTEMFDDKDINVNNREKNIEEKDKKNKNLPIIDIYLHVVTITRMRWRKQDTTNCFKSLMLSHLYHSLRILDKTTMIITCNINYNLNLLNTSFRNS